ncbi:Core-2/I-Branching enzyme, partial [Teladorsagia circumcincta]
GQPHIFWGVIKQWVTARRPNLRQSRPHVNCEKIRERVMAQQHFRELPFGVAYARIVYENYDIVIKTVYETIYIFQALDGTNDIGVTKADPDRWDHSAKWDMRSLGLFPDETKATPLQLNTTLKIRQALAQASLSRDAVNWMVNTIDVTKLMDQFNND